MHLFRFPRDAESRKIWENKVRRANWSANENHRLCQAHFLDDQFETNHADGLKKLKSTAVPTIFCHRPRPRYRKAPVKRTSDVMDSTTEVTMEARERRISFRGRIVGCHEAGQSIRTIAKNLGISTRTVLRWIRRSEDTDWYGNLPRGRPPRCTTPAQRRDILQAAEADPQTNAVAIRESLHLDVSERTVRRVLHEAGVHHRTPANKEFLTDQHREGRLLFAQQYVDKPEEFWKRVIWTDEKTFSSSCHGKRQCWRRNDTRDSPENVNIWGWVSWHGMGDMQQIEDEEKWNERSEDVNVWCRKLMMMYGDNTNWMRSKDEEGIFARR
ncbi:hypothetical protein Pmani_021738 [Petrolisthes manimaculis]|uniref:THAP-type domain-containing protein n=1 Tax=Petrolisthes manimaculis TaxID=1843537 RepID=A0AAE1PG03_9EUCA|nr:hypothetical protein Pmani_021738 [Petrolisthes manimaculis]